MARCILVLQMKREDVRAAVFKKKEKKKHKNNIYTRILKQITHLTEV